MNFLLVLLLFTVCLANVVPLTNDNFDKYIKKSPVPVFVKFFSPGCPHCVSIAGTYTNLAKAFSTIARIAEVNCQSDNQLCGKYQIQGVPSFKLFYGSQNKKVADYQGAREGKAMANFISKKLPTKYILPLEEDTLPVIKASEQPSFVLFSSKQTPPAVLKSLSLEFRRQAAFYFSSGSDLLKDVVGDKPLPAIVYMFENEVVVMEKEVSTKNLSAFVREMLNSVGEL
ncbi:hypothetical protein GEMRC1_011122 [Eukaryota sp. GEM-RC1]